MKISLTPAAISNCRETATDPETDVAAIRSGEHTRESLLAHCLDGADADRVQGWHEYVSAVCDAAQVTLHLVASAPSAGDRHVDPDATARILGTYANAFEARSAGRACLRQNPGAWLQIDDGQGGAVEDVTVD